MAGNNSKIPYSWTESTTVSFILNQTQEMKSNIVIYDALRDLIQSVQLKNTHGGLILLVKLQAEACNFTKSITPSWVFFIF